MVWKATHSLFSPVVYTEIAWRHTTNTVSGCIANHGRLPKIYIRELDRHNFTYTRTVYIPAQCEIGRFSSPLSPVFVASLSFLLGLSSAPLVFHLCSSSIQRRVFHRYNLNWIMCRIDVAWTSECEQQQENVLWLKWNGAKEICPNEMKRRKIYSEETSFVGQWLWYNYDTGKEREWATTTTTNTTRMEKIFNRVSET